MEDVILVCPHSVVFLNVLKNTSSVYANTLACYALSVACNHWTDIIRGFCSIYLNNKISS